jgi:predicted amidohydrolase
LVRIALLQMNSGVDPEGNFNIVHHAAVAAREGGARMLLTPEMSLLLDRDRSRAGANITWATTEHYVQLLARTAVEQRLFIALGSMASARADGRWANRSLVFTPDGVGPHSYDKIHMFDVDLAEGESWRESDSYEPGEAVVSIDHTPIGRLGLTICYDLRFPALFDVLGRRRCDAIAVPAAFTVPTGRAHWHVLLRARAIEASAYVIAAAQVGLHEDGRRTFGHSLVVDPWGEIVLDMGGDEPGLALADIDRNRIAHVRQQLPSLANRRPFAT